MGIFMGIYPLNIQKTMEHHHFLWVNQLSPFSNQTPAPHCKTSTRSTLRSPDLCPRPAPTDLVSAGDGKIKRFWNKKWNIKPGGLIGGLVG